MRELYESGMTTGQVAEVVGLDQSTVYRKLVAAGVSMRGRTRNTEHDAEVAEKYQAGRSIQSLAREYHFNKAKVLTILRDAGVETRKRGRPKGSADGVKTQQKTPRHTGPTKKMRKAVLERDQYHCQMCGRDVLNSGLPYSLQHRLPRGRGGTNTMCNLVTVCGSATTPDCCHDLIENQARRRCTREGWLVPNGKRPEEWPVLRRELWSMPGQSWVEVEPHPMQLDLGEAAA